MKWFKKFVSMCAVGLGGSKKEVDLVASDSTNEIDLGSHGFKGKDDWAKIEVFFKMLFKRKHDLVSPNDIESEKSLIDNKKQQLLLKYQLKDLSNTNTRLFSLPFPYGHYWL